MNAEPDTASAPWARALEALERRGRRRRMRRVDLGEDGRWIVDGRPVIHLSSNDYLGLARHPAVLEAAESDDRDCLERSCSRASTKLSIAAFVFHSFGFSLALMNEPLFSLRASLASW